MRVRRRENERKIPRWLIGFLSVLLLAGLSLGVAMFWQQKQEETAALPSEPDTLSTGPEAEGSASLPELQPEESSEEAPDSTPAVSAVPVPPSPEEEAATRMPLREKFSSAVPERQAVDNSYFDDAIFFGVCISTGIPLYQVMKNAAVVAYTGINTQNINTKQAIETPGGPATMLEAAKQYGEKSKVYIMLGANGLDFDKPTFIDGYRTFVASVKAQYPGAAVYLQSMTPVTRECYKNYPSVNNEKVEDYNVAIMQLANEMGVYYVDVAQALMDENGELPMDASPDGMHMMPEYYNKWFDYLKTHTVEAI